MFAKKHLAGLCFAALLGGGLYSGCSPKAGETVVAKVGPENITLTEYETLYLKSNNSREQAAAATQEERERFLDLMTKFKLKLADAYTNKLDQRPDIQQEIVQYKGSLVASFLTEREVNNPGIKNLFNKRQFEVRVKHILLALAPDAPASDSVMAYAKAFDLIASLRGGASFESLAVAHSNDPSVAQNKGDLYYFTAGRMVPEFEEAAFAMKPGDISARPVRTQYGLHIMKCVDRKPSSGELKASHIMIRFNSENPSPDDTLAAYNKILELKDSLKAGIDFAELAIRHSQDPGSSPRGGDLGWFMRGRWIQPFDEEAFKLKPGQTSDIVRTIYGYHLIKVYEARPPKSLEESRRELSQIYQQTRFPGDYAKFMDKLKQQTQYKLVEDVLNDFVVSFDSMKTTRDSAWSATLTPELGRKALIMFGNRAVSCDSVVAIMMTRPDMTSIPLNSVALRQQVDKIAEQLIFQVKGETIEKEYPEFASIMKEYVDGILLYQIEQERVWGRVEVTDSALHKYYNENRERFVWPDRVNLTSVSVYSDSLAQLLYSLLQSGKTMEELYTLDSVRVSKQRNFTVGFAPGKSDLSKTEASTIALLATDLKEEPSIRVQVTVRPDTSVNKKRNEALAAKRLESLKSLLTKKHGIKSDRILTAVRAQVPPSAEQKESALEMANRAELEIIGRYSWFIGKVDNQILPVTTDERTLKADSLAPGAFSSPFNYRGNYTIVRLNKKEPARQKTFEEAGTEVSSAFQEYESKRLEREWLDQLRRKYPVVEYKDKLQTAFARVQ